MGEQPPPGLINLPEHVLHNIAEYVSFPGVLMMRKVCTKLRTDLDNHRPSIYYPSVMFEFHRDSVHATHYKMYPILSTHADYRHDPLGVAIGRPVKKLIPRENYMKMFSDDFVLNIFKHKTKITTLHIIFNSDTAANNLKESFVPLLDHRWQKPQVRCLVMTLSNVEDIDSILPHIDANAIKKIQLLSFPRNPRIEFTVETLEKLSQLDSWKNTDEIILSRNTVLSSPASISHFLHLKKLEVFIEVLGLEELKKVMETMRTPNSKLESAVIGYVEFPAEKEFSEGLGNPTNGTEQKGPNKEFLIKISSINVRIGIFDGFPAVRPPFPRAQLIISTYIVPF